MLDSKNLPFTVVDAIRNTPLDDEARRDLPLQTKQEIYDRNCADHCGFARIECRKPAPNATKNGWEGSHFSKYVEQPEIFVNIDEALHYARLMDADIKRTCEYPGNIIETRNGIKYPSLTGIVSNGCRLWDIHKIEIDDDEWQPPIKFIMKEVNVEQPRDI